MIGALGMAAFYIYRIFLGLPERFPPSFEWVFFSMFFAIWGYQMVRQIHLPAIFSGYLSVIGANSLFFFVVSTISIFILQKHYDGMDTLPTLIATIAILMTTYFLSRLILPAHAKG